jgi:hypothetical protein
VQAVLEWLKPAGGIHGQATALAGTRRRHRIKKTSPPNHRLSPSQRHSGFQEPQAMIRSVTNAQWFFCLFLVAGETNLHAQKPPYDVFPPAEPLYYRVRYEAS